jgi:hypothetical protein
VRTVLYTDTGIVREDDVFRLDCGVALELIVVQHDARLRDALKRRQKYDDCEGARRHDQAALSHGVHLNHIFAIERHQPCNHRFEPALAISAPRAIVDRHGCRRTQLKLDIS